eukprot:8710209-Pyramimonas_sp.AAC.1
MADESGDVQKDKAFEYAWSGGGFNQPSSIPLRVPRTDIYSGRRPKLHRAWVSGQMHFGWLS